MRTLDGRMSIPFRVPRHRRLYLGMYLLDEVESQVDAEARREAFIRTGNCVCNQCGENYIDHPADPVLPDLTILCSREQVKL